MTKSTLSNTSFKLIALLYLTSLTVCISKPGSVQKQPIQSAKTIVEVNRFYSVEYKQANYNITKMTAGKSLILTLLRTNKIAQIIKQGLTITFSGGGELIICPFKKITDLCVVPDIPQDLKMVIKCQNLPCQVQWKIYQPTALVTEAKQQPALNLYNLQNSTYHLMGQITCNSPEISTLNEDITIYSQTEYTRVYYNNIVYVMFASFSKGYVYVDVGDTSRNCAFISFKNVPQQIKLNQNDYITDFVTRNSLTSYNLAELPKTDFSIECQAIRLDSFTNLKSTMQVSLLGTKNGVKQHIITQKIKSIARSKVDDFTYIFKVPKLDYTELILQLSVENSQIYLINFRIISSNQFIVELGQTIYFNLLKGQKINLKIAGQNDISQASQTYYLIQKRKQDLKVSSNECDAVKGCLVQVQALVDTDNLIYISSSNASATQIDQDGKGSYQFQQIQFIPIDKQIKHKIRLGQNLFLSKKVDKQKTYQIHVNSPNVILYASSKSKCIVPDTLCRERTGNYHHPFVYEANQDDQLLINVEGLENTQFQLTVLQNNKMLPLTDGTAFSYSMDEQEQRIDFTFKLHEKSDVSFNLISPLNVLRLYVVNSINSNQDLQIYEQSTDGYIQFAKEDIKGLDFTISVQKISNKQKYFSHFTIIASSEKAHIRLQPSVTTYQTLSPSKSRQFIFEFDRNQYYVLSLSTFNLKKEEIKLELQYSKDNSWSNVHSKEILKEVDFIKLNEVSAILCSEQGQDQCQIFIKIINNMQVEVDLVVTLIKKNSVMQLKDGIWQVFPSSQMITASSYYFYPRHSTNNILILYHSSLSNAHVSYRLWRYDIDQINPQQWPFPFIVNPEQQLHDKFKKNNYISIDHQQMAKLCWPNCVVLLSISLQVQDGAPGTLYQYSLFKVMASNSQIELPQKHKGTFTLGKQEDKQILIDLKYPLTKDSITFYTTSTIGQCTINANVYSQKQQKCPIVNEISDFSLNWGEHKLQMASIKEVLNRKEMEDDRNIYLCIGIHSQTNCKITLEYTAQEDIYKQFHVDTFQDIKLETNQTKLFELDGMIEQYSKLTRLSGFPFVVIRRCQSKQNLQQCKTDFAISSDKGKQIVAKTESLSQQSCPTCTFLVKISSLEPAQLRFHSQTKFSQIQLKQKVTISDFLNQNEENKYQIHAHKDQDLIINIHVQQGNIQAKLTDAAQINLLKKSTQQKRVVQFIIKSQKKVENDKKSYQHQVDIDQDNGEGLVNPLALSNSFRVYHLTISSPIKQKASSFSIGYSSGARQFFLQDGLIVDYQLQTNKLHTFFYCNQIAKDHILYTISTLSPDVLKRLKIVISSYEDINDEQSKKELAFQRPALDKKSPNPSLVFKFPSYNCFSIDITNPSAKTELVSMGINHQQVMFLPFNHEYPFILHKQQYLNILTDVNIPGFIQLQIKKCDQSTPTLAYTFDYDGFVKGEYLYQAPLTEQFSFKYHIKAYRIGTLYIKIQANLEQSSTASIKLIYSEQKVKPVLINAGNHGLLNYQFISSTAANITFQPVECGDSECKNVKYFAVSSDDQQNVYQQLVCPNAYFKVTKAVTKVPIPAPSQKNTISFTYTMETGVSFVGVMATVPSGSQVYYKPIQISTLWAKWGQASTTHQVLMTLLVLMALCVLIVWVRRLSRKGYRPLEDIAE